MSFKKKWALKIPGLYTYLISYALITAFYIYKVSPKEVKHLAEDYTTPSFKSQENRHVALHLSPIIWFWVLNLKHIQNKNEASQNPIS